MSAVVPSVDAPVSKSWAELAKRASTCTACAELSAARTLVVPGVMPKGARLMLIGEAPGADEDRAGLPFIGRSGKLLDELLSEVGLDRAQVTVSNVVKCRPPDNRTPKAAEIAHCRPWLDRQIELANPSVIVTLGTTATQWALGRTARIGASRGQVHEVKGYRLLVTFHPSAALRFGPRGAPMAGLREDLALAARLLNEASV